MRDKESWNAMWKPARIGREARCRLYLEDRLFTAADPRAGFCTHFSPFAIAFCRKRPPLTPNGKI